MLESHRNNFDFLRFVAAAMVWWGHCFAIFGVGATGFSGLVPWGSTGVAIFFIISGYFVTMSYQRNGHLLAYIRNRALRILPALFVVVLLCVFVLGPLVTTLQLHDYFTDHVTWRYLRTLLIFPLQYDLPGVFGNQPVTAVNGSLWTLQHEVRCYGFVALFGLLGIINPRMAFVVFTGLWLSRIYGTFANLDLLPHNPLFDRWSWGNLGLSLQLMSLFASGALMYAARATIALRKEIFAAFLFLFLLSFSMPGLAGGMLFDLTLPYLVIYLGFLRIPLLARFSKYGDFSYGFYLYAYPMQQLTLHLLGRDTGFATLVWTSLAFTLSSAVASWYMVENPALQFKK